MLRWEYREQQHSLHLPWRYRLPHPSVSAAATVASLPAIAASTLLSAQPTTSPAALATAALSVGTNHPSITAAPVAPASFATSALAAALVAALAAAPVTATAES